eukprot:TRINITY_DN3961_c0_g1_i1.p1 TRINITY_DN3961_c0_g1~~TRINITY_DN3961_c0_g1_i1.p1  ORF type:complete len:175 (+),score=33.18 TRINITY_DN3961_c0_g1_i1:72-596(+)
MSKVPDFSNESWSYLYIKSIRLRHLSEEDNLNRLNYIESVEGGVNDYHNDTCMLIISAERRFEDEALLLLQNPEIDINLKTGSFSATCLMWSVHNGLSRLTKALCERPELEINAVNNDRKSALMFCNKLEIAKMLLARNDINVFLKDKDGKTADEYISNVEIKKLIKNKMKGIN